MNAGDLSNFNLPTRGLLMPNAILARKRASSRMSVDVSTLLMAALSTCLGDDGGSFTAAPLRQNVQCPHFFLFSGRSMPKCCAMERPKHFEAVTKLMTSLSLSR